MAETWQEFIRTEQLPEDYQLIADIIGIDLVIKLSEKLKSVHIYLKNPDKLFLSAKIAYVLDRYKNASPEMPFKPRLVALETGLSERFVYELISDQQERAKQIDLFPD